VDRLSGHFALCAHNPEMLYALLKTLHVLAIIVWVGGMVFAHFFLRPALASLEPPQRLTLMRDVLRRFFVAVSMAALLVLITGAVMITLAVTQVPGASFKMPLVWTLMATFGLAMMLIYAYIRMALFPKFDAAVRAATWPAAAAVLNRIRQWVGVNLVLGVLIVVVTLLR
jgi:uncharacterized membrane protein